MKAHRLYTLSSLVKVFHGTKPAAASENRGSMLKNETFSFQVVIEGRRFGVEDVTMKFGGPLAPFLTANLVREIHALRHTGCRLSGRQYSLYPTVCGSDWFC